MFLFALENPLCYCNHNSKNGYQHKGFFMIERKPRIAVTLSDEARDVVNRLAALEDTSASRVIASIVEEFLPVARQLVELGESAGAMTEDQKKRLQALAAAMEAGVVPKSQETLAAFQAALTDAKQIVTEKA